MQNKQKIITKLRLFNNQNTEINHESESLTIANNITLCYLLNLQTTQSSNKDINDFDQLINHANLLILFSDGLFKANKTNHQLNEIEPTKSNFADYYKLILNFPENVEEKLLITAHEELELIQSLNGLIYQDSKQNNESSLKPF